MACTYILKDFKSPARLYEERHGEEEGARQEPSQIELERGLRPDVFEKGRDGPRGSVASALKPLPKNPSEIADFPIIGEQDDRSLPKGFSIDAPEIEHVQLGIPQFEPAGPSGAFLDGLHLERGSFNVQLDLGEHAMEQEAEDDILVDFSNFESSVSWPTSFETEQLGRIQDARDTAVPEQVVQRESTSSLRQPYSRSDHSRSTSAAQSKVTYGSTTEHSRNVSTAPTSRAITPARTSKRASSQVLSASSQLSPTIGMEWMRFELERHRAAEEELRSQQELENQVISALELKILPTQSRCPMDVVPIDPPSKPLTHVHGEAQQGGEPLYALSGMQTRPSFQAQRQLTSIRASESQSSGQHEHRKQRSTAQAEGALELDNLRSQSRQSRRKQVSNSDDGISNQHAISRDAKNEFRQSHAQRPRSPASRSSRASSRSRRLVQVHGSSFDITMSRRTSMQGSEAESRARSMESIRNAFLVSPPTFAGTTSNSNRHSHDSAREAQQSSDSRRKSKPSVNLNRELPPLPSLGQWEPMESEKSKHISTMVSPKLETTEQSEAASPLESDLSKQSTDESPRIGTSIASTSRLDSIYSRYSKWPEDWSPDDAPPYTSAPTDADFVNSATHERFDIHDADDSLPLPAPPRLNIEPQHQRVPSELIFAPNFGNMFLPTSPQRVPREVAEPEVDPKSTRRKTEDMFLPDLDARARVASNGDVAAELPNFEASKQKTQPARPKVLLRKNTAPAQMYGSGGDVKVAAHSKTASEQINLSRRPESPNFSKLYELGYRNIVQIPPPTEPLYQQPTTPPAPARSLSKSFSKRLWMRGTSRRGRTKFDMVSKTESQISLPLADDHVVSHYF